MSIKVMSTIWDQSSHEGSTLLLLLALADHASDDGVCWPGIPRLARKARKTERHIKRLLTKLEESGELYIARGAGRGNTNMYYIALGLNQDEMARTLIKRFEFSPDGAARAANYIANLQGKGDTQDTFLNDGGDVKGDIQGQEKVTPTSEKVTPTSIKGDIAMSPEPSLTVIESSEENQEKGDFPENSKTLASRQMIQATADLFDEVGPETPEEIDAALRGAGYDPDEAGGRMKAIADQAIIDQIIRQAETHPGPLDLARETVTAREEAGGNYATPVRAGGADLAAEAALSALYTARGSEPPLSESKTYRLELEKVSQVLRDNGVTDPDVSRLAAQMMCKANEESPKFVNPHYRSFPSSFTYHLGVANKRVAGDDDRRARDIEITEDSLAVLTERRAARPPPPQDDEVGTMIKTALGAQMGRNEFQRYVRSTRFTCDNGALVITAPDEEARDWLEGNLGQIVKRALAGVMDGPQKIIFEVAEGTTIKEGEISP